MSELLANHGKPMQFNNPQVYRHFNPSRLRKTKKIIRPSNPLNSRVDLPRLHCHTTLLTATSSGISMTRNDRHADCDKMRQETASVCCKSTTLTRLL